MTQHHSPRYIPLCPNGNPIPILYIDANAPLDELQAFAEQRVRSVAQVLDSLSLVSGESLEGRDLAYIAHLAAQVLEEGCEVMAVMQKRLAQQAT
jgi:hypothetical protein